MVMRTSFVLLMLLSIVFNYLRDLGYIIFNHQRKSKQLVLLLMVIGNLSCFMYSNIWFLVFWMWMLCLERIILSEDYIADWNFFFLLFRQWAMYLIFIAIQKKILSKKSVFGRFVCVFVSQLIAGPIVRYETIAKETWTPWIVGSVWRNSPSFFYWFVKKVLLANNMARMLLFPLRVRSWDIYVAWAICYTLQIYFDFSGDRDSNGLGKKSSDFILKTSIILCSNFYMIFGEGGIFHSVHGFETMCIFQVNQVGKKKQF